MVKLGNFGEKRGNIYLHLAVFGILGEQPPITMKVKREKVHLFIPEETHKILKQNAEDNYRTLQRECQMHLDAAAKKIAEEKKEKQKK